GYGIDRVAQSGFPFVLAYSRCALDDQVREPGKGRHYGIENRVHDRIAPLLGFVRHYQQRAALSVRAHRGCHLHEPVHMRLRLFPAGESAQRFKQVGTVREALALLVDDLHLLAFQDGDVCELAKAGGATMLDDEQTRLDIFEHEAETGDLASRSPDIEFFAGAVVFAPDPEVNA